MSNSETVRTPQPTPPGAPDRRGRRAAPLALRGPDRDGGRRRPRQSPLTPKQLGRARRVVAVAGLRAGRATQDHSAPSPPPL